eukprot:5769228-Prymnesium_polylepis.1
MSEAAVRAAAEAEGLTLVPSGCATGFRGVLANGRRFTVCVKADGGKHKSLGTFNTALEAALVVARQLGPEASAAAVAAAAAAAAAAAILTPEAPISEASVRAVAEAEGLTLVPSDNAAGFRGVCAQGSHYFAYTQVDGKQKRCG